MGRETDNHSLRGAGPLAVSRGWFMRNGGWGMAGFDQGSQRQDYVGGMRDSKGSRSASGEKSRNRHLHLSAGLWPTAQVPGRGSPVPLPGQARDGGGDVKFKVGGCAGIFFPLWWDRRENSMKTCKLSTHLILHEWIRLPWKISLYVSSWSAIKREGRWDLSWESRVKRKTEKPDSGGSEQMTRKLISVCWKCEHKYSWHVSAEAFTTGNFSLRPWPPEFSVCASRLYKRKIYMLLSVLFYIPFWLSFLKTF